MSMTREEVAAWLQLVQAKGIGNGTARRLLAAFGLPQQILAQSPSALAQVLSAKQIAALRMPDADTLALIETTWQWLQQGAAPTHAVGQAEPASANSTTSTTAAARQAPAAVRPAAELTASSGALGDASKQPAKRRNQLHQAGVPVQRRLLVLGDPAYPPLLLQMADPPVLLYAMGQVDRLLHQQPCIAMVGSRNPTPQGASNARAFGKAFAEMGWAVVSGLALGVDGAAHEGALQAAEAGCLLVGGKARGGLATIAVVGTGLDRVYPRQHHELAHRIVQHGVILSESPLGTPPLSHHFPKRNRIIAGLSQGVLVVEAALQSGSLITARLAGEQGKEVFAIPGSIHAPQSRGCHALIKQGAKLVESAQDVMEELRPMLAAGERNWMAAQSALANDVSAAPVSASDTSAANAGMADEATGDAPAMLAEPLSTTGAIDQSPVHEPLIPGIRGEAAAILQALGHDPAGLDALLVRTGMETATLQAKLLELELMGLIGRLPGGLFQRIGRA